MIGNTDWYVLKQHNIQLVQSAEQVLAVPYDFDYAGLVNAPYALPHRTLPIASVVERYYIGACREREEYEKVIQLILDKQADLLALVEQNAYLTKRSKSWMLKYLRKSFRLLEDPEKVQMAFALGCGWTP